MHCTMHNKKFEKKWGCNIQYFDDNFKGNVFVLECVLGIKLVPHGLPFTKHDLVLL